jgi:hypothetical protein
MTRLALFSRWRSSRPDATRTGARYSGRPGAGNSRFACGPP